jgi:hypothetical protein
VLERADVIGDGAIEKPELSKAISVRAMMIVRRLSLSCCPVALALALASPSTVTDCWLLILLFVVWCVLIRVGQLFFVQVGRTEAMTPAA